MLSNHNTVYRNSCRGYTTLRNLKGLKIKIQERLGKRPKWLHRQPRSAQTDLKIYEKREYMSQETDTLQPTQLHKLNFEECPQRQEWSMPVRACESEAIVELYQLTKLLFGFTVRFLKHNKEVVLPITAQCSLNIEQFRQMLESLYSLIDQNEGLSIATNRSITLVRSIFNKIDSGKDESTEMSKLKKELISVIIILRRIKSWSLYIDLLKRGGIQPKQIQPSQVALKKINKIYCLMKTAELIKIYVYWKQRSNEICYNCEKPVATNKMLKHIKICKELFELQDTMETLDAQILAKVQDLKEHVMMMRKIQIQKQKQQTSVKRTTGRPTFRTEFTKTANFEAKKKKKTTNQFDDLSSDSDNSSSQTKIPTRPISSLKLQEVISYLWVLEQLKSTGQKIKQQRESNIIELQQDLKNVRSTVSDKYKQLNIHCQEVDSILMLMDSRYTTMEKIRKAKKLMNKETYTDKEDVNNFCNEYENYISMKAIKNERSRHRAHIQHYDKKFDSEEEKSIRMSETDTTNAIQFKDFKEIKMLGKGKYGQVLLVRKRQTKVKYAMKRVYIDDANNYTQLKDLNAQNDVFSVINSSYLVKAVYSFSEGNYHYFVMEYMPNGNFAELLQRQSRLYESEAKLYLAEIVVAIEDLHRLGIAHRDIKPQNIVIDKFGHLKITDFGLSEAGLIKRKHEEQKNKTLSKFLLKELKKKCEVQQEPRIVGSPYYMSPEILSGAKSNHMTDWWSFGILMYHTLLGVPPFTGSNLDEIRDKVFKLQIWPSCVKFGTGEEKISYDAKDMIERLLRIDPEKRLGVYVEDIKEHKFFESISWDNLREMEPAISFTNDDKSFENGYETEEERDVSVCSSINGIKLIRRDVLNDETANKHKQNQQKYSKLMNYAEKLTHKLQRFYK